MTIGLNKAFPDCGGGVTPYDGVGTTSVDYATRLVVLIGVDTTASSTVDLTGYSTIFWGLLCALLLST